MSILLAAATFVEVRWLQQRSSSTTHKTMKAYQRPTLKYLHKLSGWAQMKYPDGTFHRNTVFKHADGDQRQQFLCRAASNECS